MRSLWRRSDRAEKTVFIVVLCAVVYLAAQIVRAIFFL